MRSSTVAGIANARERLHRMPAPLTVAAVAGMLVQERVVGEGYRGLFAPLIDEQAALLGLTELPGLARTRATLCQVTPTASGRRPRVRNESARPAPSVSCNNPPMPGPGAVDEDVLRNSCTRFLSWHGMRRPADLLAELPDDIDPDRYGDGGVVTELEAEVSSLLGKPTAVFLPSGTMAQQVTLRVHADARGRRVVLFHPACHIDQSTAPGSFGHPISAWMMAPEVVQDDDGGGEEALRSGVQMVGQPQDRRGDAAAPW